MPMNGAVLPTSDLSAALRDEQHADEPRVAEWRY
jgi:hypothetical protein